MLLQVAVGLCMSLFVYAQMWVGACKVASPCFIIEIESRYKVQSLQRSLYIHLGITPPPEQTGSDHRSRYHGFCRPERKQTTQRATFNVNTLFAAGDRFLRLQRQLTHHAALVSLQITSPHLICLLVISISSSMNKKDGYCWPH